MAVSIETANTLKKGKNAMYDRQTAKFIAMISQNVPKEISEEMMQWWIDHPPLLQDFLTSLTRPPEPKLEIWKTIRLGRPELRTPGDFLKIFEEAGIIDVGNARELIVRGFPVSAKEKEVDLVRVKIYQIGFTGKSVRVDTVYKKAKELLGLEPCPAEVGPLLCSEEDWSFDGMGLIAMEPIHTDEGLIAFSVEKSVRGVFRLGTWFADYSNLLPYDWELVFVKPRKQQK